MKLPLHEYLELSNATLAEEMAMALLAIECGRDAVATGDCESLSIKCVKEKACDIIENPERYPLFTGFQKWRNYGFDGRYEAGLPSPHDGYALVLLSMPAVELYGGEHAHNCAAVLQAMVAREKIDGYLNRPTPGFVSDGLFLEFSVGGEHEGLTAYELALLSGMSVQSVRNEFQKGDQFNMEKTNGVATLPLEQAHEWLLKRRGYTDSYVMNAGLDKGVLLVPQARDGSFFSTHCKQGKGYKLGKRGGEFYLEDFKEALSALEKMSTPYWRRPSSKSGVPGIVSGVTWVHKSRKDLGLDR